MACFSETPLYADSITFLSNVTKMVCGFNRDNKQVYGYDLIKTTKNFVVSFAKSFKTNNNSTKYQCCLEALSYANDIEITLFILNSTKNISPKQFRNLFKHLGLMLTQLYGWQSSLEKKLDY